MEIISVKQLDNGMQKKPYADHIYHWNLQVKDADETALLNYCKNNLKDAAREQSEYFAAYRDNTLSFHEHMMIICKGWYSLTQKEDGSWDYIVHYEYID